MIAMETGLKIFEKPEFGSVRVVEKDGDPWFVAKDVCEALGYQWNGAPRIAHVPDEWRGATSVVTPSGEQEMLTLSEQGLYFFLGRSDKPAALPFQKWLAGDVLPSIRKTGSYGNGILMPNFTDPLAAAEAWIVTERARIAEQQRADYYQRTKAEIGNRREATAMATASVATRKVGALEDRLGFGKHYKQVKAIPWLLDEFVDCRVMYQQVGKKLSAISQRMGIEVKSIPCPEYPQGVKAYHVDVVNAFQQELQRDLNMLGKWRLRRAA